VAVPTAVFSLTVGFFAPFGLAIFSLRLAMVLKLCRAAAFITTICLSSPAASADAKLKIAPSTVNAKQ
jgi:hypothetical protein